MSFAIQLRHAAAADVDKIFKVQFWVENGNEVNGIEDV